MQGSSFGDALIQAIAFTVSLHMLASCTVYLAMTEENVKCERKNTTVQWMMEMLNI